MQGFDVGGSHKSQQSGYEASASANQARVVTDGVDTTEGTGGAGLLRGLLRERRNRGERGGQRRRDEHAGRGDRHDDQERRQHVQGAREPSPTKATSFVGDNIDADIAKRGGFTGQPNLHVLGRPRRARRPDHEGQALVLRRVQPLQDRQGDVGRRRRASRPTSGSSTTSRRRKPTRRAEGHASSATTSGARSRSRCAACRRRRRRESALAQDSPSLDVQGRVAARVVATACSPRSNVGDFGYDFPVAEGGLHDEPAAARPGHGRATPARAGHAGGSDGAVHRSARQAAGRSAA